MINGLFMAGVAEREAVLACSAADRAASSAAQARSQVELMQSDIEKLLMITEALWILLRDEHGYTDEHLARKVQEIDMRDGRLDGKVAKLAPARCPQCGRVMSPKRPACLFCGALAPVDPFRR